MKSRNMAGLAGLLAGLLAGPLAAQTIQDDPYIWLEKLDSPEAMQWVKTENAKTLSVLEKDPRFEGYYQDALTIAEARDRIPQPEQLDGRIYNFWQDAEHVKGIWRSTTVDQYRTATPKWTTVLDLDALARTEKANWVWKGANCEDIEQRRCLISLSDGGEDAVTIREFDLRSARFVDKGFGIPKGKSRVDWQDKNTLLVAREWAPGELTTSGYPFVVKRLRRGVALDKAEEVFRGKADDGGYGVSPSVLHDATGHRAVLIVRPVSTFEFEKYIVTAKGAKQLALPKKSEPVGLIGGKLVLKLAEDWQTGKGSFTQGSLVSMDLAALEQHPDQPAPTLIVAPGPRESIEQVSSARDALLVDGLDNVRGRIRLFTPKKDGSWEVAPVSVPDNSVASISSADWHSAQAYVNVTGFLQPPSQWQLDTKTRSFVKVREIAPKFDASDMTVQQFEAASSDGVKIPYFVVASKILQSNGKNPTILYAYGGFQVSVTPRYMAAIGKLWLEKGGVFVVANIRGGGEFGPAWHDAGLKTKRQIIYDDFVGVAHDLVSRGITDAKHLGIEGGSNGGLLMGVQMTQHPELWNAVDIQVPLLDMLRFESIAAGTSWVGEYGSVANPDEKNFLASISPYNNLKKGVAYPQALIWTTTKDDRVGPQHARKFAARLSEFGVPYLFYEVVEGGHGAGANLKETAHTNALEYTYFARQLMHD